ncbi:MAG: type II toxin-antitoxin system RelE/ParE family toxin [Cyanobacteria bacterium J06560_6]
MDASPQEVGLYFRPDGSCPFTDWLEALRDRRARAKIRQGLDRLELGNMGDFKPVGKGVLELRVNYGLGYRVYFVRTGQQIILLLCGGDKKTQNKDILRAQQYWMALKESTNESS